LLSRVACPVGDQVRQVAAGLASPHSLQFFFRIRVRRHIVGLSGLRSSASAKPSNICARSPADCSRSARGPGVVEGWRQGSVGLA